MNEQKQPQPLTIEQIAHAAQEALLRSGRHLPTLVAEGSSKTVYFQFEHFGQSPEDNQRQLREFGFRLASNAEFGMLKQAFFISEAWMSQSDMDKQPTVRPSQDAHRREILMVSGLAVSSLQARLMVYELIRDRKGRLIEIKPLDSAAMFDRVENPLLEALFFGFVSGQMGKTRQH